jgi:peptidyl-prolyl cis-trans isomerase SurA
LFFEGKWDKTKAQSLNKKMFVLSDKVYTQEDFTQYLDKSQRKYQKMNIAQLVNEAYSDFVEESAINYEDGLLETKYPEFKALMKEYRDGIMLFELTDKKVWSKAIEDTTGMKAFYNEKEAGKYMWGDRVDASIYTCNNLTTAESLRKLLPKVMSGKMTESALLAKFNNDSVSNVIVDHKKFSKGDNPVIDSIPWKKGITKPFSKGNKVDVVAMFKTLTPEPKSIKEAKGLITADYQNYLEKEWIAQLRKKYPVEVNKDVFESLIKN